MNYQTWSGGKIPLLFLFFSFFSCHAERTVSNIPLPVATVQASETNSEQEIMERGKRAYLSACIQCHNRNPHKKGPIGPELTDTPIEVMREKVKTGLYPNPLPEGFTPRRKTKVMKKLPNSLKDVEAIHLWINAQKKS